MRRNFEDIEISDAHAGYLAGMLDGEGWISIGRQHDARRPAGKDGYYYVFIGVTNTHKPLLDWLVQVTGRGKVHSGTVQNSYGNKPRWVWVCRGWSAADVLRAALPHLIEKKERALIAVEFAEARHRNYANGRRTLPEQARGEYEAIYEKFKAL